ncbi:MAG: ABC transporter permease [Sporolactobacillus sp.]
MPVFNICLKIFRKNINIVLVYLIIFCGLSVLFAFSSNSSGSTTGFAQERVDIALISKEQTPLTAGLKQALAPSANFIALPDQVEQMQDALFFNRVSYILRIPSGFSASIMHGGTLKLDKRVVSGSADNAYIDRVVRQYFQLASVYAKYNPALSQAQIAKKVIADLAETTPVTLSSHPVTSGSSLYLSRYFNFSAYALTVTLLFGIATIFIVLNDEDISRRLRCAPLRALSVNAQLALVNLLFAAMCWAFFAALGFLLDWKDVAASHPGLLLLNSGAFSLTIAGFSYLVGSIVTKREALSAIANIFGLGTAFLSGAFVPQELMNGTVLKVASFTPTYWFVTSNDRIHNLTDDTWPAVTPIIGNVLIVLAFGVAFFVVALVLGRRRQLRA